MKIADILDAVTAKLAVGFPDWPVQIEQLDQHFSRPALLCELLTVRRRRLNIGVDESDIYLTITIREKQNPNRKGDVPLALAHQQAVMELFRLEVLPVGDRMLPVKASEGGQGEGESYVDLMVTLREPVGFDPDAGLPLIETVKTHAEVELIE